MREVRLSYCLQKLSLGKLIENKPTLRIELKLLFLIWASFLFSGPLHCSRNTKESRRDLLLNLVKVATNRAEFLLY